MIQEKRCSVCHKTQSVELFGKDPTKHSRDGYTCRCRNCAKIIGRLARLKKAQTEGRELRKFHTNPIYDENGICIARRCSRCKEIKRADEFSPDNRVPTGLASHCKKCVATTKRRPEAMNSEYHKNSRRNHSLLKKNCIRHHTEEQWEALLVMTGYHCLYPNCDNMNPTRDHIIPLKAGGDDGIDNIQPLCLSHNGAKQDKLIIDYRPSSVRRWAYLETNGLIGIIA